MIFSTKAEDEIARLALADGRQIILLDRLGKGDHFSKAEVARNIYCVALGENLAWQVHSDFDGEGQPFTHIRIDDGSVLAYRWDGGTYTINLESGRATPVSLDR
jgi:hypothetical protein